MAYDMNRIRILIVDRSIPMQQKLQRLLERDPNFEVVGAAVNGHLALANMPCLRADLVLLDIANPELDGLQTLATLREAYPTLPMLVFSQLTGRGASTTLDALQLGASACLLKPSPDEDLERCVLGELSKKIKTLSMRHLGSSEILASPPTDPSPAPVGAPAALDTLAHKEIPTKQRLFNQAEIVAIAASTGGPKAISSLLTWLPKSFATPIIIVQHMAPGFTKTFANSLRRQTGRDVRALEGSEALHAATVWLAPSGRHLVVRRNGVSIEVAPNDEPPENACSPSADVMFRSVAEEFGSRSLAVMLTGMGCDGLAGCRVIREAGGTILVQDQASSACWGMPGQVATAGLADEVLSLTDLPQAIVHRTSIPSVRRAHS